MKFFYKIIYYVFIKIKNKQISFYKIYYKIEIFIQKFEFNYLNNLFLCIYFNNFKFIKYKFFLKIQF